MINVAIIVSIGNRPTNVQLLRGTLPQRRGAISGLQNNNIFGRGEAKWLFPRQAAKVICTFTDASGWGWVREIPKRDALTDAAPHYSCTLLNWQISYLPRQTMRLTAVKPSPAVERLCNASHHAEHDAPITVIASMSTGTRAS